MAVRELPINEDSQFGRSCKLILSNGEKGLDLSEFRVRFFVKLDDCESTNKAFIRVYNLRPETTEGIVAEFNSVLLQAGYRSRAADIFHGTIIRFEYGRESATDNYLEIVGADGDYGHNFAVISMSFAAGSSTRAQVDALAASMGVSVDPSVYETLETPNAATGGVLPRGRVMWGMSRAAMSDIAKNANARWSIQNGVLTLIPLTGYLPGDAVVLNRDTGLVGTPCVTEEGINVRALLNPLFRIGNRVQINNADITKTKVINQFYPGVEPYWPANVYRGDGVYRIIACAHCGDTRGQEWYSDLICLAIDGTAPPENSVKG